MFINNYFHHYDESIDVSKHSKSHQVNINVEFITMSLTIVLYTYLKKVGFLFSVDAIATYSFDGHDWTSKLSGHLELLLLKRLEIVNFKLLCLSGVSTKTDCINMVNVFCSCNVTQNRFGKNTD